MWSFRQRRAINNDAIGFSPSLGGISGTWNQPGSSTRSNSSSMDAIQEVQVQLAPYDVSLGNFTGGSINAVSRSGSNEVTGSVYSFQRNAAITGKYKGDDKVGDGSINSSYYDYQTGFRIGLPIIKDKLFWFTNEEVTNNSTPVFFPAGAPGYFMTQAIADQITAKLKSMPSGQFNPAGGYDPGATGDYNIYSKSQKYFNRFDWKISRNHTPWNNQLDMRLMQDFYFKVGKKVNTIQLTFDIINFSNMLSKNWGIVYFTPNTINSSVDPGLSITSRTVNAAGVVSLNATYTTPTATYSIDQFSSRWQAQVGLRYIF